MTNEKAIEVIRAECYVANPLDIDRAILVNTALDTAIKALEAADLEGYSSRLWKAAYERGKADAEQTNALDKIIAEIKEWYWQADKQTLAKDPCVVDAMIDLFIRTIRKYKAESEDKLDGDPIDIDKAVEHYERTLETLKGIDLEDNA